MKTKEEKSQKNNKKINLKSSFLRDNWVYLVLICLAFVVIASLCFVVITPYTNKKSLENNIANLETTSLISIDKVVCYSSAFGISNHETQARWNLNLSQYTDMAIYLNVQTNISKMYIDSISFSNSQTGNLSLSYLPLNDFGKSPISALKENNTEGKDISNETNLNNEKLDNDIIASNSEINSNYNKNNISNAIAQIKTPERIELEISSPITLRYLNYNLKENCSITDIENPLSFDGSILKRGKVTISSLKNTISFRLHFIDNANKEYVYPIKIDIPFESTENDKSIYDGSYVEEIPFSDLK